ncbi:hypothetical protein NRY95_07095 [Xanthomonas campestris pv. phormiicola]|nr:hypothetical protein [Xanthomonas campestris pv. phormiicola]UYC17711.1 hypothetical protein NRY95_07095 [Xanthomonas campestris pv. phormiicola]
MPSVVMVRNRGCPPTSWVSHRNAFHDQMWKSQLVLSEPKAVESGAGVFACGNQFEFGDPGGTQAPATDPGLVGSTPPLPCCGPGPGPGFTAEHAAIKTQTNAANPVARFIAFSFGARKTAENATSRCHAQPHGSITMPNRQALEI